MRKIILLMLFSVGLLAQSGSTQYPPMRPNGSEVQYLNPDGEWYAIPDSGRSVNNSFYSVDLNGTDNNFDKENNHV